LARKIAGGFEGLLYGEESPYEGIENDIFLDLLYIGYYF
jgi:hypothetical protein